MSKALDELRGCWAVVTGATSGIGLSFAGAIAKSGLNLVIVGRCEDKLVNVARKLKNEHGVAVEWVMIDLAEDGADQYLYAEIQRLDIRVALLVNNAGAGFWGRFEKSEKGVYRRMITLNTYMPMALALVFSDHLAQKPSGIIINVSSAVVLQPVPYMTVYAASKSALHQFGLALHEEWYLRGVRVQTLVAGPTDTDFDVKAGFPSDKLPSARISPQVLVECSLSALDDRKPLVFGPGVGIGQRLFGALAPISLVLKVVGRMFRPSDS